MAFPRPYGRYILEDRLAMGGMAEIFRARTATAGFEKRVCIKRVLPHYLEEEDFVTMFRDEAKTAARLQHANVVQVFDFGEVEEEGGATLYLAMELVEGSDLRRLADQSRKKGIPFTVGEVAQIGIEVCRGLHHAHSLKDEQGRPLGIVHRDVSPHNILISKSGEVKVTDFGIARAAERATHTSTGIVKGKVAYMSPEQAEGRPFDHRLDQWALGVILWELLCGERLFRGENDATILRKVLNVEVPSPSSLRDDVPAGLEQIILRALAGDPADRFRDMREMELALSRFLFAGAVDPATADVAAAWTRIMEGGAAPPTPRRTAVLEAVSVTPPADPPTLLTEDIAAVASVTSDEGSQVFVSSEAHAPAPGPRAPSPQNAETQLVVDEGEVQAAIAAFEQQKSSSSKKNLPAERSRPSTRAPAAPAETLIADGDLVAAARAANRGADDDGTPATRTVVPATGRSAPAPAPTTAAVTGSSSSSSTSSWGPKAAAAAIVVMGAVAGIGIAVSGPAAEVMPAPAPATPTPPTPTPPTTIPAPTPEPSPAPVSAPAPAPMPPEPAPAPTTPEPPTAPTPTKTTPTAATTPAPPAPAPTTTTELPRAPGTVYVDVIGGWGTVSIGRKSYGETPVTLTLVPGRYTITLESGDGTKKKSVPITVTSGGKSQVRETL